MLSLAHINARSLTNNFDTFKEQVLKYNFSIVGISESWLNPNVNSNAVNIDEYNFIRQDRVGRGGGVGMYLKNDLPYSILLSECRETVEHIWIKIQSHNKNFIAGNLYRPPSASIAEFLAYFEDILIDFYAQCDYIMCCGDFNINALDVDSPHVETLTNILSTFNMEQIITEPTRISDRSSTLIDLICVDSKNVREVGAKDINISDHLMVHATLDFKIAESSYSVFCYRALSRIDVIDFQRDLEQTPWNLIYEMENIDEKVTFLNNTILNIFDIHAPLKIGRNNGNNYCPWITDNIKFMKQLRNQALNRFRQTRSPEHWNYYKQLRNLTTSSIRAEKKAYLNYKFQNCTPKEQWNELKKLKFLNKKTKTIPDHLTQDINKLNTFFTELSRSNPTVNQNLLDFYSSNSLHDNRFIFTPVNEELISHIILKIKSKAFGADNLNITLIALCCPLIIPVITHIMNCCITKSYFPLAWKQANVTPIPKINSPSDISHLRSISILPTFSKILEKVMESQISSFLSHNNILPQKQSGFRPEHSCSTALSDVVDDVVSAQDHSKATIVVLLDYTKAFDMLHHHILVAILRYIGFDMDALRFISSFLTDRTQRVVLGGVQSGTLDVTRGVPQGSILGPLLFSIYTSNFIKCLKFCNYHLYADDTQIYISFNPKEAANTNYQINNDLNNLYLTSENHLLKINPQKSAALLFCADNVRESILNTVSIRIGNEDVNFKNSYKNLGLIMDIKLKFKEHITLCMNRAFSVLKHIFSHRHSLSRKTKTMLCDSLILSHFNYCDNVYGPFLDSTDVKRIQKMQNYCIRLIYGIRRRQRVSNKLKELGWLNMVQRRTLHSVCLFYKIIKFKSPPYLLEKLKFRTDVHNLNLRRQFILTIPRHNKELYKKSFTYQISFLLSKFKIIDFNPSVLSLKKKIKQQLLEA